MIFAHTYLERRMWRGWLRDGQTLEISWGRCSVGAGVKIHSHDVGAHRFLWLALGWVQFFIPFGIVEDRWSFGEEPAWSFDMSREMGLILHWKHFYKSWRWPFHTINLDHSYMTRQGWRTVPDYSIGNMPKSEEGNPFWNRPKAHFETHPYTYNLERGEVQRVTASVLHERRTMGRNILSRLGWPSRIEHVIDVHFDGEVGERAGSWKGGTIGCGYEMNEGEQPVDTLRRMERDRKF